jgi:hypothetical protein
MYLASLTMMISSSSATTPRQLSVNPAQVYASMSPPPLERNSRSTRDASLARLPPEARRAFGDRELAQLYGKTLLQVTGVATHDSELMVEDIPPHSAFGQWWAQLGRAFQSQEMVEWMQYVGANPETVKITAASGEITYQLKLNVARAPLQTRGPDDKGWSTVSGPVMEAAQVIAGGSIKAFKPPLSQNSHRAPLWLVQRFYREQAPVSPDQARQRAAELERNKAFPELDMLHFSGVHAQRSEGELERQKAILGNLQDQRYVAGELNHLGSLLQAGSISNEEITHYLDENFLDTHPDSAYRQQRALGTKVSLKAFIEDNGWDLPSTQEQVQNLEAALLNPVAKGPVNGNYGGALAWQEPLDPDSQRLLREPLSRGRIGDIDFSAFKNALEYLMHGTTFTPDEPGAQRRLETLIQSPKGQALGRAIQAVFEARSVKGSVNDWLLAALSLDQNASPSPALAGTWVAGFDLAREQHWGKPASTIAQHFVDHLHTTGRASSTEAAVLQAHLLLAPRAPALLVKEIPGQLLYGSHGWVSFTTAVARIEDEAPGSTATMTYGQVMTLAEIAPISAQQRHVEYAAQQAALKVWGVANGIVAAVLTDNDMSKVRKAYSAQIAESKQASLAQQTPMPSLKAMALEQLKRALPDIDPALLEEKCLALDSPHRDFPGPYSILDLYLAGKLFNPPERQDPTSHSGGLLGASPQLKPKAPHTWVSSSNAVSVSAVLEKTRTLAPMLEVFSEAFAQYCERMENSVATQVKSVISQQPLEVRKNLEYAKLSIVSEHEIDQDNFGQVTTRRTSNDNCLLVKTERNGHIHTYEINLKQGRISEREDLGNFQPGEQPSNYSHHRKYLAQVTPPGQYTAGLNDEQKAGSSPDSFNSERTAYIANALVKDINIRALEAEAKGMTTFDTEVPFYKKLNEFMLNLIPLRSAIVNFQNGNNGAGLLDLTIDVFGFVLGVGVAAKGAKALQTAASVFSKLGHGAKIIGRAAIGSLNPLNGLDDLGRGVLKAGHGVLSAGRKGIKQLRGTFIQVDPISLAKKPTIAQGTLKLANGVDEVKVFAKFDDTSGNWHAMQLKTQQPYGRPLENFKPDPAPVETLRKKVQTLHEQLGRPAQICYQKSLLVGQADNALPLKTRNTVLGCMNTSGTGSNYTPGYSELMGITPGNTQGVFNPASITESGIINFMDRRAGGGIVHTAYIQKTSDNKLFIYNINQPILDGAMVKATGNVEQSAGALVHSLDNDGLQNWLDTGYDFAFTPNSTLNANVQRLAA